MNYVPLELCLENSGGSIYKLAVMVAMRAQELAEGAKTLLDNAVESRPIYTALCEVVEGQLSVDKSKNAKKQVS